jgi:inhibitor of KinA
MHGAVRASGVVLAIANARAMSVMEILPGSDSSLLVVFGSTISLHLHRQVLALFGALRAHADPRIRNLHPGYASLLIDFDPLRLTHQELASFVRQMVAVPSAEPVPARLVTIPVCYDPEFGPDLVAVARAADLTPEDLIRLHSEATYIVYFLGFSPGFAYLGGLPQILHVPRLTTPRKNVAAGTVGIAGSQTGIYPVDSPGGWRLIGRTPISLFTPNATPPTLLQPGDTVKFSPIDREKFRTMADSLRMDRSE